MEKNNKGSVSAKGCVGDMFAVVHCYGEMRNPVTDLQIGTRRVVVDAGGEDETEQEQYGEEGTQDNS